VIIRYNSTYLRNQREELCSHCNSILVESAGLRSCGCTPENYVFNIVRNRVIAMALGYNFNFSVLHVTRTAARGTRTFSFL
jgi:hypothetical protein